jgi:effector-binding domain-containing protein
MIYDVDIARVPEQGLLALRARGPITEIGSRMARLRALAAQEGLDPAGPLMGRFYGEDVAAPDLDFEVCLPVAPRPDGSIPDAVAEARGELVPAHHVLTTTHVGRRDELDDAVKALREALEALGYRACGPLTEVYVTTRASTPDPADDVTELRLPYAR